ncbi:MAG TPA: hypothetical protein VFL27_08420 [Candidatus Dormibacteraeota bacterium]|nr:hypothetical protein [Candidatus Dormibacteraeota bacterium]
MRNLIRTPLTWLVVAEFVVVGALIAVAWTVVGNAARAASSSPSSMLPARAADTSSPLPDIPDVGQPGAHGPLPGLNLDSAFWRERLVELNRDQMLFVQLEWRVIHAAMDAIQRYLETVVMPAVRAAEGVVP